MVRLAACGVTSSIGVWFQYAVMIGVTRLVMPGPFWAMHMVIMPLAGYVASNFSKYGVKLFNAILLPPWGIDDPQTYEFFNRVSSALEIPIMIQDAPVSGTVLSAAFLARMAVELERVAYFKIESPGTASKLRELIRLAGDAVEGPWDGEEGITLFTDLEAGATGSMTGGGYPDGMRQIVDAYLAGQREKAFAAYQRWLPLINYENRQCGLLACKALMKEGGVIECDAPRHPILNLHPATRAGLIETARRLEPMVLRWGR